MNDAGLGLSQQDGLGLGKALPPPPQDDAKLNQWIDAQIGANTRLNFIDRVARPTEYPTLKTDDDGMATHLMSWATMGQDKTPVVYPSIIFDPESRALKQLDDVAAFDHAMKTKEFLSFPTSQEADLFSREYKRYWREGRGPKGYQP